MSKADVIEIEGTVVEKLPNTMFQVLKRWRKLPLLITVYHKMIPLSIHSLCRTLKKIPLTRGILL